MRWKNALTGAACYASAHVVWRQVLDNRSNGRGIRLHTGASTTSAVSAVRPFDVHGGVVVSTNRRRVLVQLCKN